MKRYIYQVNVEQGANMAVAPYMEEPLRGYGTPYFHTEVANTLSVATRAVAKWVGDNFPLSRNASVTVRCVGVEDMTANPGDDND